MLLDPLPLSTTFTVGLTSCSRSQHDLNFTVGYDGRHARHISLEIESRSSDPNPNDGRHASYSISSDFRGYQELDHFDDDADNEEGDAADAGAAADDGTDYE